MVAFGVIPHGVTAPWGAKRCADWCGHRDAAGDRAM
jgi:hypothetical protein